MRSFLRSISTLVLGIVLPLVLQLYLRSRMPADRRERGWSRVTWAFALYAVGPLSMLPFCWVTRRWRGLLEGVRALAIGAFWTVVIVVALNGADQLYALATDLPP